MRSKADGSEVVGSQVRGGEIGQTRTGMLIWEKLHDIGAVEGEDGDGNLGRMTREVNEVATRLRGAHNGIEEHKLLSAIGWEIDVPDELGSVDVMVVASLVTMAGDEGKTDPNN